MCTLKASRAVSAATCVIRHWRPDRAGAVAQGRLCGVLWGQSAGPHRLAPRSSRLETPREYPVPVCQPFAEHTRSHTRSKVVPVRAPVTPTIAASIILLSSGPPLLPPSSLRRLWPNSDTKLLFRTGKFLNFRLFVNPSAFSLFDLC